MKEENGINTLYFLVLALTVLFCPLYDCRKLSRPQTEYAAPEQQQTERGSFPVDLWALGTTLYEVVVGVRPNLDGK